MGIDVANTLWTALCAAAYVQRHAECQRLQGHTPAIHQSVAFMREALRVADEGVQAWTIATQPTPRETRR